MTKAINKDSHQLYVRLCLTPYATKLLMQVYTNERDNTEIFPSDRACRMFVRGEIQPKNGFNGCLLEIDQEITEYALDLLNQHKAGDEIVLRSFNDSDELWDSYWESQPDMYGVPVELHNAMLNRIHILAQTKAIQVNFSGKADSIIIAMPIREIIRKYLAK